MNAAVDFQSFIQLIQLSDTRSHPKLVESKLSDAKQRFRRSKQYIRKCMNSQETNVVLLYNIINIRKSRPIVRNSFRHNNSFSTSAMLTKNRFQTTSTWQLYVCLFHNNGRLAIRMLRRQQMSSYCSNSRVYF